MRMYDKLVGRFCKPKYAIIIGVKVYNRAVFTLVTIDYGNDNKDTIKCKRSGLEFYKSNVYKYITSFKALMRYGRLLAPSVTKPLSYHVLEITNKGLARIE